MDNIKRIWDTGLDWLTFTLSPGHPDYLKEYDRAHHHLAMALQRGEAIEEGAIGAYKTLHANHIILGEREDGLLVQYSSRMAHVAGLEIANDGSDIKVTRLDVQSTVKDSEPRPDWSRTLMDTVLKGEDGSKTSKRSKINLYHHEDKNFGIVVGSEKSDLRSRHYDKYLEQKKKTEPGLYRHELQLRRKHAVNVWNEFKTADDKAAYTNGLVKGRLAKLGIKEKALDNVEINRLPSTYEPDDDAKFFDYFEKFIAPKFRRQIDKGNVAELARRMNLSYYQSGSLSGCLTNQQYEEEWRREER